MKKYVAIFEVPDGFNPQDFTSGNATGYFTDGKGNNLLADGFLTELDARTTITNLSEDEVK